MQSQGTERSSSSSSPLSFGASSFFASSPYTPYPFSGASSLPDFVPRAPASMRNGNNISARAWHNRYMAWQTRDRRQREEKSTFEAERNRIFGEFEGEGEDEEGLCVKMLDYFGGLDFID
jgi:hypothetical protein